MYNFALPKVDGVSQQAAAEMNSVFNECVNVVITSGQTQNNSDNFQLSKSLAIYANSASFCVASGSANAYILSSADTKKTPTNYFNGMRLGFYVNASNTGATTINAYAIGTVAVKKNNATTPLVSGDLPQDSFVEIIYNSSAGCFDLLTKFSTGELVQFQSLETGAVAIGTTLIPYDDTIPTNTEGDQYMSLAITPTHAANLLIIDVNVHLANTNASPVQFTAALFQDSNANALAVGSSIQGFQASDLKPVIFRHVMIAGTTSSTTFKVRGGGNLAGTTTFNGSASARKFGGVLASSITIMEIAV